MLCTTNLAKEDRSVSNNENFNSHVEANSARAISFVVVPLSAISLCFWECHQSIAKKSSLMTFFSHVCTEMHFVWFGNFLIDLLQM